MHLAYSGGMERGRVYMTETPQPAESRTGASFRQGFQLLPPATKDRDPIRAGREKFSRMLRVWQERGGWAQNTPARLAAALGWRFGPHNSQWSLATRSTLDPKPVFFHSLGWLNAQIARAPELSLEIKLKQRILAMEPIRHADTGQLWTSADFAACYLDELAPPAWALLLDGSDK